MAAKDIFHDCVKRALVKDGWTITHDPYRIRWKRRNLYADLGAERIVAAEKGIRRIVVEIKSFVRVSEVADLENALGQYYLYQALLARVEPERELYLAVPHDVFVQLFQIEFGELFADGLARVFGYDVVKEEITGWIP